MKSKKITLTPPEGFELPEGEDMVTAVVEFAVEDGMLVPQTIDGIAFTMESEEDEMEMEDEASPDAGIGAAIMGRMA